MTIVPLVVGYFAIQWNRANFLGKSPEQIVAMGREKWSDLYGNKVGQSTRDMCDAQEKYAIALQNLNDRALKRLPKSRQIWLEEIRKDTTSYASEAHQIGEIVSGGGTMWRTFDSTIRPDVEEIISDCIVNKAMPTYKMKSFSSSLSELDSTIKKSEENASDQFKEIPPHRTALIQKHAQLEKLFSSASNARPNDVTRVRLYMNRKMEVAKGDNLK